MQRFGGKIALESTLNNSDLRVGANEAKGIIKSISDSANKESKSMINAFRSVGGAVGIAFSTAQAFSFAKSIVQVRGEIEALEVSFRTLLGNKAGDSLFYEIRKFATNTPMGLQEAAKAALTMLGFQIPAEKVMGLLQSIGDIAMGDAQRFQSLTLAFSQMSSTGKLLGQDLNQMINAGFNPLGEIAKKTGKSIGELKANMDTIPISAQQVEDAFMSAASAGGMFHGMLEDQSQAIKGSMAKLEDSFMDMKNAIGVEFQEQIVNGIQAITKLVENYEKVGKVIAELIVTYGAYRAALIVANLLKERAILITKGYTLAERKLLVQIWATDKAQKALNATMLKNPYVAITALVIGLGYATYKLVTAQTEAEKAQEKLNKSFSESRANIEAERVKIDTLFATLKHAKKGTDEYKTAKETIINQYGQYLTGLGKEIETLNNVAGAYNAVTKAAIESAKARAIEQAIQTAQDSYIEATAKVGDRIDRIMKKVRDANALTTEETTQLELNLRAYINGQEKSLKLTERQKNLLKNIKDFNLDASNNLIGTIAVAKHDQDQAVKQLRSSIEQANKTFGGAYSSVLGDSVTSDTTDTPTTPTTGDGSKEARKRAELAQRRKDDIRKYANELKKEEFEAQMAIEQARIDAMEEGLQKQLDQNALNYERAKQANKEREQGMVEALRDEVQAQYDFANPNGNPFDRSTITVDDLTESQKNQIAEYERIALESLQQADERVLKADQRAFNEHLRQFGTYLQKRKAMVNLMNEEADNATSEGERLSIIAKYSEEIAELDRQAQGTTTILGKLFGDMSDKTTSDIREVIKEAEELQKYLSSGEYSEDAFGITREQYETIRKSPDQLKAITDEIEKLNDMLGETEFGFEKIKTALDKIRNSKVGSQDFKKGMDLAIEATREITDVANAAVDAFSNIATVLGGGEIAEKAQEVANDLMNVVDTTLRYAELGSKIGGKAGAIIGGVVGAVSSVSQAITKFVDRSKQAKIEELQVRIDALKDSYSRLDKEIEKAYGRDAGKLIEQSNTMLKQQQALLRQQIEAEKSKKKSDSDAIKQMEDDIKRLGEAIDDNNEKRLDVILGGDIKSQIEDIQQLWEDAFTIKQNPEKSAQEFVKKRVQAMVREGVKQYSSTEMQEFRKMLDQFWSDEIIDEVEQKALEEKAQQILDRQNSKFGWSDRFFSNDEDTRSASSKGIATASQDSVDELNGRFTAIQGHTYAIMTGMQLLQTNSSAILNAVLNIEMHTRSIDSRMESMESDTKNIGRALGDIQFKGIKAL